MTQRKLGKHVTPRIVHWSLEYHNESFVFTGSQFEHNCLLQGLVDRIFDGPAIELSLRVDSQVQVICVKRQIFWAERREEVFHSFWELLSIFINRYSESLFFPCLVLHIDFISQALTRNELAKSYNSLLYSCDLIDIDLPLLTGLSWFKKVVCFHVAHVAKDSLLSFLVERS